MASQKEREGLIFVAKLAEQAERYEEMVDAMKKLAKLGVELTTEEGALFAKSYKKVIDAKRTSWRALSETEEDESGGNEQQRAGKIKEYRRKLESEISNICDDVMAVIDDHIIPSSPSTEAFIFYHKIKGDYYRYLAEFKSGNERKEAAAQSYNAYKAATTTAESELPAIHPVRLGVAVNFSVLHYEIMNLPERACYIAQSAFDHALSEIDALSEESYRESTSVMRLLKDNLTEWTSDRSIF